VPQPLPDADDDAGAKPLSRMATRCLRYGSLAFLVAQDTALVLLMRYSRSHAEGAMYLASTAVCCMEVLKLCVCVFMLYAGEGRGSVKGLMSVIRGEFVEKPQEIARLAVPSFFFLLQNNRLYLALSNLRATPYKVTYNLKILTSAMFSITMLGQKLSRRKWLALIALFVGVTVVQSDNHKTDSDAPHPETGLGYQTLGFMAVVAAAFTSGFCGVYQQRILQGSRTNMWVRNAQMGLTSVVLGFIGCFVKDRDAISTGGFFQGYSRLVWTVIVIQAVGGLNIAFILKYADNILKGFAAAFSTVASCVLEMAIMHFRPTPTFLLGGALINVAAYCYNTTGSGKKAGEKLPR
jgi:UDP-sugar transporter A1/2/3